MSYLDELLGKAGKAIDTAGRATGNILPDFGISEHLESQGANAMSPSQRVTTVRNDPRFVTSATQGPTPGYPALTQIPDQISGQNGGQQPGGGSGLGADTANLNDSQKNALAISKGYTGYQDMLNNTNAAGAAGAAKNSALAAIQQRLAMIKDIAQRNIGRAQGVRDEVVGNIGTTYGNLLNKASTAKDAAVSNLGIEDTNVQNQYGKAAGTARAALDSAIRRNRMLARAQGTLNSSFYDDTQSSANEQGAQTVAGIGQEEAGKRAGIGTRTTEAKNWFEQQTVDIGAEEAQLKSQADREFQDQVSAANDMERSYGIDSAEAAQNAEIAYQSKLDQIQNYINDKATKLATVANTAGARSTAIDSFSAVTPELQKILSNNTGLNAAQTFASNVPSLSGVSGANTGGAGKDLAYYKQDNPSAFEELQRRLGNLVA